MTRPDRSRPSPLPEARDRVPRSHAQTRSTIRLALAFLASAALAAGWTNLRDWPEPRWLPLHLFLAGGAALAISGVSLMLAVTWSAAPAPHDRAAATQRWLLAVGGLGIAVGRTADLPDAVVGTAAALHLAALALLGFLLQKTIRLGVERRFDPAVASYLTAITAALIGGALGAALATGTPSLGIRSAHLTTNLLGFVGLVIGGTLPFFSSTVGRSKMSKAATRPRLLAVTAWYGAAVAVAAVGLVAERPGVAAVGLAAYVVGIAGSVALMPKPTKRILEWSGPRIIALWTGAAWWAVAVAATAVDVAAERGPFSGRWLAVLVIGGYAQILWGSLAYLLPMLRGGGHALLGEGFAATRSWVGFAAVNVAAAALAATWEPVALVAAAIFVSDAAWRASRVGTRRADRPAPTGGTTPSPQRPET